MKYYIVEVNYRTKAEAKEFNSPIRDFRIVEGHEDLTEALKRLKFFRVRLDPADFRIVTEVVVV